MNSHDLIYCCFSCSGVKSTIELFIFHSLSLCYYINIHYLGRNGSRFSSSNEGAGLLWLTDTAELLVLILRHWVTLQTPCMLTTAAMME